MADPTIAEIHTQNKAVANYSYETRLFCETNSTKNAVYLEDQIVQALEGDFSPSITAALAATRAGLSAARVSFRAAMTAILYTYAKIAGIAATDLPTLSERLREYFETNSISFKTRAWSRGSAAAVGSPAGNGVVRRLTVDKYGKAIQTCYVETRTLVCVADANSGARKHQEVFEVRGGRRPVTGIESGGSGLVQQAASVSAADSLLTNPSFSRYTGTAAAPTDIAGWTALSSLGNFAIDETNYYRDFDGDGTSSGAASAALKIKASDTISQAISVYGGRGFNPRVPMYARIAWNRSIGSGDGDLTFHVGGKTATVSLSAQSGWQILYIALDESCYLKAMNEQALDIKIQLASRTTGYVLVDDVIFVPWKRWTSVGDWFIVDGGSTPWLVDDSWSFADTETGSKVIGEFCRAFPDVECPFPPDASPSISDP